MEKNIIIANWKMNMNLLEAGAVAEYIESFVLEVHPKSEVVICGTFLQLPQLAQICRTVKYGAQDVFYEDSGAFTGEISVLMLRDVGATHVLVGHSERRHVLGENDEVVALKLKKVLESGLFGVLCVGETEQERNSSKTLAVLSRQVESALDGVKKEYLSRLIIAYEPVWAIGTGKNATKNDAETAMSHIKEVVAGLFGEEVVRGIAHLYGGSVNAGNIHEFSDSPVINGVLVGNASLHFETFAPIIEAFEKSN